MSLLQAPLFGGVETVNGGVGGQSELPLFSDICYSNSCISFTFVISSVCVVGARIHPWMGRLLCNPKRGDDPSSINPLLIWMLTLDTQNEIAETATIGDSSIQTVMAFSPGRTVWRNQDGNARHGG